MRNFVLGDIHGGLKALHQVLVRANVTKNDTLIFLGDFVDGWSESPAVLDFLIELQKQQHCIFIRGNHDDLLMKWLSGDTEDFNEKMWFIHGGEATVLSYQNIDIETKEKHIRFLQSLQDYYLDTENRLFIHAGFTNMRGVEHEFFKPLFYWGTVCRPSIFPSSRSTRRSSSWYPPRSPRNTR
jgi:serine/threonine protein phosphatase 1